MRMRDPFREKQKELGVIQVLLDRLNTQRMPRALELKERVDRGERLTSSDTIFLKRVLGESGEARRLAAKHPEYQQVLDKMTDLYTEIMRKGAENEQKEADSG
ncbi:MAG TPA: hypothetical protein VHK24_07045 [Steroidobacter sp.]|jgi:hypothetical protein|nr:hypothetical protein [Steroidobacter sp.]